MRDKTSVSREFLAGRRMLMAFILGMVRHPQDAEDIFQDVGVKLMEAVKREIVIEDVGKWCRGVARNLILHYWRAKRSSKVIVCEEKILALAETAFAEHHREREDSAPWYHALSACMMRMPARSREILRLKYEAMLSFKQIASRLKRTVESVTMQASRLRNALSECIERKLAEERGAL